MELTRHLLSEDEINSNRVLLVTGGPGVGKSAVIGSISKMANDMFHDCTVRLGTTGTAAFVICGSTCHSKLFLPINKPIKKLNGEYLKKLQDNFLGKKLIIIDEISMMGKKMLMQVDQILREASGKNDLLFGGYVVVMVGDLRQLPPVADKPIFLTDSSRAKLIFHAIETVVVLQKSMRQDNTDRDQKSFSRILKDCESGKLDEDEWKSLKRRFQSLAKDRYEAKWNDFVHLFYEKKVLLNTI